MNGRKDGSMKAEDFTKAEANHLEGLGHVDSHVDVDPHVNKTIDRKFDLHILPWLFGIW